MHVFRQIGLTLMGKQMSGIVHVLVMRGGYQSRLMSVHVLNPKAQR